MMAIRKLLGYRGWKAWMHYNMHISLLAIFYILIVDNLFRPIDSLVLISSLGFYFMYGFLINDFYDISYDISAGKKRSIQNISKISFIKIIVVVGFISMLHLLYLKETSYIAIYIISYILATFYSAPPVRFKNRGFSGLVIDGLIEKTLPVFAVFIYFGHFGFDTILFVLTAFFIQIAEAMTHQIQDYEADSRTGIRSAVVVAGKEKAVRIFDYFIVPLSTVLLVSLFFFIFSKVPSVIYIAAAVVIVYASISLLISNGRLTREEKIFPLFMSCPYFLINNAIPPFLALIISIKNPLNVTLLLVVIGSQYLMIKYFFMLIVDKIISRTEIVDT
jgi:1,4-dihydroxy-2-naphthoate octaprenyltransferase